MYMYTHGHVQTNTHPHAHVHLHRHKYVHIHLQRHAPTPHVCIYPLCMHTSTCIPPVYAHTCMHAHIHMCTTSHVHSHTDEFPSSEEGWGEVADIYTHAHTHTGAVPRPPSSGDTLASPGMRRCNTHPSTHTTQSLRAATLYVSPQSCSDDPRDPSTRSHSLGHSGALQLPQPQCSIAATPFSGALCGNWLGGTSPSPNTSISL